MSNMGVKPVVELKQLTRSFEQGGERIDVLRGVDLAIRPRSRAILPTPLLPRRHLLCRTV